MKTWKYENMGKDKEQSLGYIMILWYYDIMILWDYDIMRLWDYEIDKSLKIVIL